MSDEDQSKRTALREHFDFRATSFDESFWARDERIASIFEARLKPKYPAVIIDAGGGTGVLSAQLQSSHPGTFFINLDISENMLRRSVERGVPSILGDVTAIPFADRVADAIVLRQVIHYLDAPLVALNECRRVLRPGGLLLVGQFVPFDKSDQQWMTQVFRLCKPLAEFPAESEVEALLTQAGFDEISMDECLITESLSRWLSRYEPLDGERGKLFWTEFRRVIKHAALRSVRVLDEDVYFDNRFMMFSATR